MEPPNDFVTKIGKIVWKYYKSATNESELNDTKSELQMTYVRTTILEGFRYYVCHRYNMRNEHYCPFKMLARPTSSEGFYVYTVCRYRF